jgi:nitrite reductase/ring-hydroxylating ferredoxin subunit
VLQHNKAMGRLDCPCHRASFSLQGDVISHEFAEPLPPLPHLAVRQRDGQIEVFAPE